MNALDFYLHTNNMVENLADFTGVGRENLGKYYSLTDFSFREIASLSGVPQAFAQFVLHAQNATMISGIVNFFKNYDFLKSKLQDFKPSDFLTAYGFRNESDRNEAIERIVNALRFSQSSNPNGLKWTTTKSKRKDAIITRFANTLIDGALYFKKFQSREDIIDDLQAHYPHCKDFRTLVKYLKGKFKHGFSVALCCDFLKEFDVSFDLAKPDVHLMDTMAKYKGYALNYYKGTDKKAFECLDDFLELVEEIKKAGQSTNAYRLDRQIWLCCSGKFFLDTPKNPKQLYLNGIR